VRVDAYSSRVERQRPIVLAAALAAVALVCIGPASARTDATLDLRALHADLLRAHAASDESAKLDFQLAKPGAPAQSTRVVVEARSEAAVRAAVRRVGGTVEAAAEGLVQARVPHGALVSLAQDPAVRRVRPPAIPVPFGTGEGVVATNASAWHAKGFTGAGVKIAIIDTGFGGYAQKQAAGELPASVVPVDFCSGRLDGAVHGTAVAEIVADEAPGAQLYLICMDSEVTLAQAEQYARQAGAAVITMSVGFFNTWSGDGKGPAGTPDGAVADARAAGILWINAAGNEAQNHWGGTYNDPVGAGFTSFSPSGDVSNTVRVPGGVTLCVFLRWDEWPISDVDYDVALYDENARRFVARSVGDQRVHKDPPAEEACYTALAGARTIGIMISNSPPASRTPAMDLFIESFGPALTPEYLTADRSVADPAASANALGVGAVCWQSAALEPFSSHGPTIDGRVKPDLVAPDGVTSTVYGAFASCGTGGFLGTSASAPHVAGAAALVKQAFPTFTPQQLQDFLVRNASDLGPAGPDNLFGGGELHLPAPDVPPTAQALNARGKVRTVATLSFRVSDDNGETREEVTLYRASTLLTTIQVPFASASKDGEVHSARWRVPAKRASYRFCVVATDRGGNASERSCAPIRVS
jgi:subtilisin family serine protease